MNFLTLGLASFIFPSVTTGVGCLSFFLLFLGKSIISFLFLMLLFNETGWAFSLSFFLLSNNIKYIDQKNVYEKLILNINSLKEIVFYKLWIFEVKETFEFIKDFLCEKELDYFDKFLSEQKNKFNVASDLTEIDVLNVFSKNQKQFLIPEENFEYELEKIFINFKDFLKQENQISNFKKFHNYLDVLRKQSKMFRRSGFEFNINNNENIEKLVKIYKSLNEINKFLSKLLIVLNSGIKTLDAQFNEDKIIFFQHFSYLYNNEEL